MANSLTPYLGILCAQFGPAIVARDANARLVPEYSRRLLNLLVQRERALPALRAEAVVRLGGVLDDLLAELHAIEGGLVLVPQLLRTIRAQPDFEQAEPFVQAAMRLLGTRTTPRSRRLEAAVGRILLDLTDRFLEAVVAQEAMPAEAAAPEALTQEQRAALRAWLRAKFADDGVDVGPVQAVIGGGSKRTLVVGLQDARNLPSEIVLRVDHAGGVVESTVVDEYRLIEAVHRAGVRGPKPFAIETGREVLGAPFVVVSKVPGRNIGDWIDVREPSRAFALGLAETLARLHRMPVEEGGDRLPGVGTTIRERVARELDFYERSWRASGEPSIVLEQSLAWLRRHLDQAEGRRAVVHGDVGCHNMLGHDGELSALLDWETAVVGNPAQDLLYAKHTVEQMLPWDDFVAAYVAAGGVAPSASETEFYRVLIAVFRMHFMFIARAFIAGGFSTSVVHAYAGNRVGLHCEQQMASALADALAREAAAAG
ncbi:MAG TPA: phosphotransferase family protein [Nevskiaceae bacterium]|nr:phosphotransferase family protein [Nevskiaceae bacterium]